MSRQIKFVTENFTLIEEKDGKGLVRIGQLSWPEEQSDGPWILLVGDCYFSDIFRDFENGELEARDYPRTIAVRGGKVEEVMKFLEKELPESTKLVVIHLGANNIASVRFGAVETARELVNECSRLYEEKKNLEEISFCLLSPRVNDKDEKYQIPYIRSFNKKVSRFNEVISRNVRGMKTFTIIDFGLNNEDLYSILGDTGFGVNEEGRKLLAESLCSLIKFKRSTSLNSDDYFYKFYPQDEEMVNRRVVLRCDREGNAMSFYEMPHGPVRLTLPWTPREESEIPKFEEDDDGFRTRKRKDPNQPVLRDLKRTKSHKNRKSD